mgnify:FL=1
MCFGGGTQEKSGNTKIVAPTEVTIERGGTHLIEFHSPTAGIIISAMFVIFMAIAGGRWLHKRRQRRRQRRQAREEEERQQQREREENRRRKREEEDRDRQRQLWAEEWGGERARWPQPATRWDRLPSTWSGCPLPMRAAPPLRPTAEDVPLTPMDPVVLLQRVLTGVLNVRPENRIREEEDARRAGHEDAEG